MKKLLAKVLFMVASLALLGWIQMDDAKHKGTMNPDKKTRQHVVACW